jgi:hypothetical protein
MTFSFGEYSDDGLLSRKPQKHRLGDYSESACVRRFRIFDAYAWRSLMSRIIGNVTLWGAYGPSGPNAPRERSFSE